MPIYEYKCGSCGETFEYTQRMSDDPKTVCESCSGPLERLISRTAFQLKGSGWYKDLYSSAKPKASDSSKPSSGSEGGGSSDSGTSSTPAAAPKADSKPSSGSGGKDS